MSACCPGGLGVGCGLEVVAGRPRRGPGAGRSWRSPGAPGEPRGGRERAWPGEELEPPGRGSCPGQSFLPDVRALPGALLSGGRVGLICEEREVVSAARAGEGVQAWGGGRPHGGKQAPNKAHPPPPIRRQTVQAATASGAPRADPSSPQFPLNHSTPPPGFWTSWGDGGLGLI